MSVLSDISPTQEFYEDSILLSTVPPQEIREDGQPCSPLKNRKRMSGISSGRLIKKRREDGNYGSSGSRIGKRRNEGQKVQNSRSRIAKRESNKKSSWERIAKRGDDRPEAWYKLSKKSLTSFGWTGPGWGEATVAKIILLRPEREKNNREDTEQGQNEISKDGGSWRPSKSRVERAGKSWRRLVKKGNKDNIHGRSWSKRAMKRKQDQNSYSSWSRIAKRENHNKFIRNHVVGSGAMVGKRDGGRVTSASWSPLGGRGKRPHRQAGWNPGRRQALQEQEQEQKQNQDQEQDQDQDKDQDQDQDQDHQNGKDWNINEMVLIPHQLILMYSNLF